MNCAEFDYLCFLGRLPDPEVPLSCRIIVVLEEVDSRSISEFPYLHLYRQESLLQSLKIAKEIAWSTVFRTFFCYAAPGWEEMQRNIEECRHAAHLLISECADFGKEAFENAQTNWQKYAPFRSFSSLKGSCKGLPAIICGAGPSLEEVLPALSELRSKALCMAAGTAALLLERMNIAPHCVCALDKRSSLLSKDSKLPLFMQSRLNPECVARFRGEKILVPESGPLAWESWWLDADKEHTFSSGWTVGNFAMHIAAWLGCDPIILVGMDFCNQQGYKYACKEGKEQTGLIRVKNRRGSLVATQRDWILAARFCEEIMQAYPERRWISNSSEGLSLGEKIEVRTLSEWEDLFIQKEDPEERLKQALESAQNHFFDFSKKRRLWKKSWRKCLTEEDFENEPVYESLLAPLWTIWGPLFLRETEGKNEELHRMLFFKKILASFR